VGALLDGNILNGPCVCIILFGSYGKLISVSVTKRDASKSLGKNLLW